MTIKITSQGDYELFETTNQHKILSLRDKQWFAAIEGQQGDILVHSDADHEKDHTLQKGHFYVVEFQDDPKFNDVPHLFLGKGDSYQELVIPNGLPTSKDTQKKVVWTDNTVEKDWLERYFKGDADAGQ